MPQSKLTIKTDERGLMQVDLNRELLLGMVSRYGHIIDADGQYLRSLPRHIDDAEKDFGLDIYTRMLNDPAIGSAIRAIRVLALTDEPRFLNPINPPSTFKPDAKQQAAYDRAELIRLEIERMFGDLQAPLDTIIGELLDCVCYGNVLAEETYELSGGLLRLKSLRVKPRGSYSYVCDQFMDLIGVLPHKLGLTHYGTQVNPANVIPREKFLIVTFQGSGGDPRGKSLLREAYNAWWLKQQTWPHYLKFLLQFGTPSMAGILPEDVENEVEIVDSVGNAIIDPDTGRPQVVSAAEALVQKLVNFQNGTAIALDHGSSIEMLESKGDGSAYINAIALYDRQMMQAVLIAIRAVIEAQHGSKADSETAQDILGAFASLVQRQIEQAIYRDVIRPIVRYNWGEAAADELCPKLSLSAVASEDRAETGNMIANLKRSDPNMIHTSQYPGIDAMLGLPERDFVTQMEEENISAMLERAMLDTAYGTGRPPTE